MKRYPPRTTSRRSFLKPLLLGGGAVLCVAIVATALELAGVIHIFHKKAVPTPHTSNQNTKGEPVSSGTVNPSNQRVGDTYTNTKGQSDAAVPPQKTLVAPSGDLVSSHHISLSANPPIQSTCQTTPGATCQISFTNGGITKTLSAQVTDDGGAAYWTWKPQDLPLTTGSWHVQAAATLNGTTKTAGDSLALEVQP